MKTTVQARKHSRGVDLLERASYIRWNVGRINLTPAERRKITLSLKRMQAIAKELWQLHTGLRK